MGQNKQKCITVWELIRRWHAPANFSYLGHGLQAVGQLLCRSRWTWMQKNRRFSVRSVCISHSEAIAHHQICILIMEEWLLHSCDSAPHPSWPWVTIQPQQQQHSVKNCEFSEVYSRASAAVSSRGVKSSSWKGKDGTLRNPPCAPQVFFQGTKGLLMKLSHHLKDRTNELWHPWGTPGSIFKWKFMVFLGILFWGEGKERRKEEK